MNQKATHMFGIVQAQNADAILISSVANIIFLTGFCGFSTEERDAYILLTKKHAYIFSNSLYKQACEKEIKDFTFVAMTRYQPLKESLSKLLQKHNIQMLGIEADNLTVAEYLSLKKFVKCKHVNTWEARIQKDAKEIAAIEKACKIGDDAFNHVLNKIKRGMTELDVALELEYYIKKQGADTSFRTIVAFGSNASLPHHVTSSTKLKQNNWVLMDFGVKLDNYCSDMTRTVFFGKASFEQKKMYNTVLDAQQKAIEYIICSRHSEHIRYAQCKLREESRSFGKPQDDRYPSGFEADKIAREHIMSQGYPNIPHSLGHGIGIEVHEHPRLSPISDEALTTGMVFSIEPGIYLPGVGGVRIEDLMVMEKNGPRLLTHASKKLLEI